MTASSSWCLQHLIAHLVLWRYLQVPDGMPCIVLAHEFFDALPVHVFRRDVHRGWLEVLVDEPPASDSPRVRRPPLQQPLQKFQLLHCRCLCCGLLPAC